MSTDSPGVPYLEFTSPDPAGTSHPEPSPASKALPAWYQMLESKLSSDRQSHKLTTVKMCMPFGDALKAGWLLRAPTDIRFTPASNGTDDEDHVYAETPDANHLVETFPVQQPDHSRNSAFLLPNAVIDTQWEIKTPDGYNLLVVPPINRTEERFTPLGLYAELDNTLDTGPLKLPIRVERTPVTIGKGDPIAQLIPIKRASLLDKPEIRTWTPESKYGQIKSAFERYNDIRKHFYRNELWTPKPGGKNFTSIDELSKQISSQSSNQLSQTASETPEQKPREILPGNAKHAFFCPEKYAAAVPHPVPAGDYIPNGYSDALEALPFGSPNHPTAQWAIDAMNLGYVIPLDRSMSMERHPEKGFHAFHAESDGEKGFHQHIPEKIGDAHRFSPMEILNIFSQWSVAMEHGYSNFYSSPINHFQRDHRSFSGIVDADWYHNEVNIPGKFTERSDQAVLERGAAITQAIPYHRASILEYAVINGGDNAD